MRVSIANALTIFILMVTFLMAMIVAVLIHTQVGKTINQAHADIFLHQAQEVQYLLSDYFEDRIRILQGHANLPVIIQGLTQSESGSEALTDFMADISLLGSRYPLFLLDDRGRLIHSTIDAQNSDLHQASLVDALVGSGKKEYVSVYSGDDGSLSWRIAVPVLDEGYPKGILMAEMPLLVVDENRLLTNSLQTHALDLVFRDQTIASFGENLGSSGEEFPIFGSEIVGRFYWNDGELEKTRRDLLFNLITSLTLSGLIVALIALVSARRLFITPVRQFRDLTHSLTMNAGELLVPTDHKMEELSLLANDFNVMVTEVRNREEVMQDLLANLEECVKSRTGELQNELIERRQAEQSLAEARQAEMDIENRIEDLLLSGRVPREIDGCRIGCLSISSQHLAGDFCEFVAFDPHTFDILSGDVMGKGAQAALIGAGTKQLFLKMLGCSVAFPSRGGLPSPAEVVAQVHGEIIDHLIELESFVTLVYTRFDLQAGKMTFVDCGHTQTLIYRRREDLCEFVPGVNVPIGFHDDEVYVDSSVTFFVGDVVLFYSDGITEAEAGDGSMYSSERLAEFLKQHHAMEPKALVSAIRRSVEEFTGHSDFSDDFTCIAVAIDLVGGRLQDAVSEPEQTHFA